MSAPIFEPMSGHFYGFEPRECGEHRTVGSHRAWCFACGEWCYPKIPCQGCEPELDLPSYRLVHSWVERWRGSASDQLCADCGGAGHDWAFDNHRPAWPSDDGPYYPDLSRYIALCRSCHEIRDGSTETCKNGHRWADGNRYYRKDGHGTICRACRRESMARARKKMQP